MSPTDPGDQNNPGRQSPPPTPAPAALPEACDRTRPDLKAFADGQLGWWRRQMVSRHVAHCGVCREEMHAMREFSAKWREVDGEPLDPGLRARILAAVPDTVPAAPQTVAGNITRRRPLVFVGAAASTALIAGVAVSLFSSRAPRPEADSSQSVSTSAGSAMTAAAPKAATSAASMPEKRQTALAGVTAPAPLASGTAQKRLQIASAKPDSADTAARAAMSRKSAHIQADASKQAAAAADKKELRATPPGSGLARNYNADEAAKQDRSARQLAGGGRNGAEGQALRRSASAAAPASPAPATASESSAAGLPQETSAASAPGSAPPPTPAKAAHMAAMPPASLHSAGAAPKSKSIFRRDRALAAPITAAPADAVTLFLEADKIEQTGAALEREAARVGGSVVNSDLTTDSQSAKSATLKLKIPAARLKAFLDYAAQFGDRPQDQADKTAKDGNGSTAQAEKPAVAQNAPHNRAAATDVIIRLKTRTSQP